MVSQQTFNLSIPGSSPGRPTKNIMYDHYINSYEPDPRAPITNATVKAVHSHSSELSKIKTLADLAKELEIELAVCKKRLSDYSWEKSPGQGMHPQHWDEANSPSYGWR